jgi:predicted nucleic acid-binding protein
VICVDASVAARWVLEEPDSDRAEALYVDTIGDDEMIYAPPLLRFDVANVIRRRMVSRGLPLAEADRIFVQFLQFRVVLKAPDVMFSRAFAIAEEFVIPAIYDAIYIALAEWLGCDYWTADRRIQRVVGQRLPFVRLLEDYVPKASTNGSSSA